MRHDDLNPQHDIDLAQQPAGQAEQAVRLLQQLPAVQVECAAGGRRLQVSYPLRDYTLQQLEDYLCTAGFQLDHALLVQLKRALIHYRETLQRDSLTLPDHDSKVREIYILLYPHHPHGDADDTPEELRHYH